jgi:hypothetical protein
MPHHFGLEPHLPQLQANSGDGGSSDCAGNAIVGIGLTVPDIRYIDMSAPPTVPTHAPWSLPRALYPSRVSVRDQVGRFPGAGVHPQRRMPPDFPQRQPVQIFLALADSQQNPTWCGIPACRFQMQLWACNTARQRYNLGDSGLEKEVPV